MKVAYKLIKLLEKEEALHQEIQKQSDNDLKLNMMLIQQEYLGKMEVLVKRLEEANRDFEILHINNQR